MDTSYGYPEDVYQKAVLMVREDRKVSASYVARRMEVGYNHAFAIVERMESEGVVSPANHIGKREVL